MLRQAIRLNPFQPYSYLNLGLACRETGRYEEGVTAVRKCLQLAPNSMFASVNLVALYIYAGREDEARPAAAEIHRIEPDFSIEGFVKEPPGRKGQGGIA